MLVICDFDGVLFEAKWESLQLAYEAVIREEGKNPKDFFKTLLEFKRYWRKNNQKIGIKNSDKSQVFYDVCGRGFSLFPWTLEIIPKLSKKHRLAIFTNRHSANAKELIKPISRYFQCIIGCEDVRRLKPNPEGIYRILYVLNLDSAITIKKEDVLMIGDLPDDIMAGKAAGIKTGAVKWGLGDWDELMAYLPDYSFEEPAHLLEI